MVLKMVCEELRKLRREHEITIKSISDETGYTSANICAFEKGINNNALLLIHYLRILNEDERTMLLGKIETMKGMKEAS